MGRREQENRKRKATAKSCQSLDTSVSKVPHQEPSDADNDSAVWYTLFYKNTFYKNIEAGIYESLRIF